MLNPLNNPLVVKTVLVKAQEELNDSLIFRKRQFDNPNLYMWVEIEDQENMPYVCLKDENDVTLVRMNAAELIEDKDIQNQLKKIPVIIRPFINFKKIIPEMNEKLGSFLGKTRFLKISQGKKKAVVDLYQRNRLLEENIDLYQIFG